jgi:hypothetical protein
MRAVQTFEDGDVDNGEEDDTATQYDAKRSRFEIAYSSYCGIPRMKSSKPPLQNMAKINGTYYTAFLYPRYLTNQQQGPHIIIASSQDSEAMQSQVVRMAGSVNKEDGVIKGTTRSCLFVHHVSLLENRSRTRNCCTSPS